jgi:hypothetical protein
MGLIGRVLLELVELKENCGLADLGSIPLRANFFITAAA